MSNLELIQRQSGDVIILDMIGNVTMGENSTKFRSAMRCLLGEGKKKFLLNVDELSFIDSSDLGEITAVYREGRKLKMENLTKHSARNCLGSI